MRINHYNREPMAIALAKQDFKKGVERNLFYLILNQLRTGLNVSEDLFQNTEIQIFTKHLKESNYLRIKEVGDRITSRKIRFIDDRYQEFDVIVPFTRARFKKGVLTVTMNGQVMKHFLELSKGYSEYQIEIMQSYKSEYTQRMYEIFSGKKKLNNGVWNNVEVDYLKSILNAESYTLVGNFLQKVVNVARDEMIEHGDIYFEYEKVKTGRKVTHLDFRIYYANKEDEFQRIVNNEIVEINNMSPAEKAHLFRELINEYTFTERQKQELMKGGDLLRKFYEINKKIASGEKEVENKTAYMATCLGFAD